MPSIPSGVIIIWPGDDDDIPSGWDRETSLDTIFAKGTANGVNPDVTGGATTHIHASDSHTHPLASHQHAGTSGAHPQDLNGTAPYLQGATTGHTHTYTMGAIGGTSGTGPAWNAFSSDPEYVDVIYIESDGSPAGFPQNSMVLMNTSTLPTGWTQHSPTKDKFLRGAAADGDGAGTGGAATHTHAATHSHSTGNHDHGDVTSSTSPAGNGPRDIWASLGGFEGSHNHTATMPTSGSVTSANASPTHDATNGQPDFHTLWGIINGGSDDFLATAICMWLGALGNIPDDWELCDGTEGVDGEDTPDMRGKFVKLADVSGDIGTTGGDDNHTHTGAASHSHSGGSHTHSVSLSAMSTASSRSAWSSDNTAATRTHTHQAANSNAVSASLSSAGMSTTSQSDSQPAFRTVAFIQSPGGAVLDNVMMFGTDF